MVFVYFPQSVETNGGVVPELGLEPFFSNPFTRIIHQLFSIQR
jgi:hypothetical protein